MLDCYYTNAEKTNRAVPLQPITLSGYAKWLRQQPELVKNWLAANNFRIEKNNSCVIPDADGHIASVIFKVDAEINDFWEGASLAADLPAGEYYLQGDLPAQQQENIVLAWGLESYNFSRYKTSTRAKKVLHVPESINHKKVNAIVNAVFLTRDLINTPSEDMGPAQLAIEVEKLASQHSAEFKQWIGDALLKNNYPAIHTVGRASTNTPRLLELRWGNDSDPKITLVGKGVCFDSGGLNLKPTRGMRFMKKDMGGAAHVLGLASMLMATKAPVQLRVLIPAVDNVVAGNAYRPGDVLKMRQGLTVEIDDTDAEGRLVLADALTAASEDKPDLIIDIATLTGAARIAMGTELPAMFSNSKTVANGMLASAQQAQDPLWEMPLFKPYKKALKSKVADLNNTGGSGYGGAITAALFLEEFIAESIPWVHFDLMAWNNSSQPGRPEGGEAMGLRAMFEFIKGQV